MLDFLAVYWPWFAVSWIVFWLLALLTAKIAFSNFDQPMSIKQLQSKAVIIVILGGLSGLSSFAALIGIITALILKAKS